MKEQITYDTFDKVDIRVGTVISVKISTDLLYNSFKLISVLITNNYYKYFNYERTNNIRYFRQSRY